jgi:hypothetical protein
VAALGALAIAVSPVLLGDGTLLGTIKGRILDESEAGVPGAAVEIVSADRGIRRNQITDVNGNFYFPVLQTGAYTVRAALSGFQAVEKTNNIVAADRTTAIEITIGRSTAVEEVTAIGEVPLVDKTNTSATTTVRSTLTQKLAIGRDYQSLIANAPGVTNNYPEGDPNVHGALDSSNQYLFDGVDTTDVAAGTLGHNLNSEAIEEVVVSTAGISAEYGRAQGAIVNVITKSGTNDFAGSAKAIVSNDKWNEDNKGRNPITGDPWNRERFDENVWRYALTLGGPFWRDHLWFFGAYEWANVRSAFLTTARSAEHPNGTGESYQQVADVKLWDAKITFQVTPSHLFSAAANSDPMKGSVRDYWERAAELPSAEREALTLQDQNDCAGFCVWQARWSGVFGPNLSGEAFYAEQDGDIVVSPFEGGGSPYFNFTDELYYNGATFDGFVERSRKQANLDFNLNTRLFRNSHNFKVGMEYQELESVTSLMYPNNESFFVTDYDPTTRQPILSRGDFHLVFTEPQTSVSTGKIFGFYVLDKFEAGKNLFLNFGFRLDNQQSESDIGNTVINSTTVSPRLTGVYDVFGNGKTLFSVAYGLYYEFLIQDIADSVYMGVPPTANYDLYEWNGTQFVLTDQIRVGGDFQPVNQDLNPSHLDEIDVSIQRQLGNAMAIGLRGIYRKWNDLVDDRKTLAADGTVIRTPRNFSEDELARYYKGFELTLDKRLSRGWQASINYTLSRSEGNQASSYSSQIFDFEGLDCVVAGIGAIPCSTALNDNLYGYLSYDRRHIFQAFTAFNFPLRRVSVTASPSFLWQSGSPYQPQRTVANSRLGVVGTHLFEKRGSRRLPNTYQLDFALEAVFKPWRPIELGVKGEVFNVTNQQQIVSTDGIRLIPGANFGVPTSRRAFQAPRSYRFTGLVRF